MAVNGKAVNLSLVGAFLVGVALFSLLPLQGRHHDRWERELREVGTPMSLTVSEREIYGRKNKSQTMIFRYEVDGRAVQAEIPCLEVCLRAGLSIAVWVNPADPTDFVTDYGQLSGHRTRSVQGFAVAGALMIMLSMVIGGSRWREHRRALRAQRWSERAAGTRSILGKRAKESRARFRRK